MPVNRRRHPVQRRLLLIKSAIARLNHLLNPLPLAAKGCREAALFWRHPRLPLSSQGYQSFDKLPYIGPLTPANSHILVATGFSLWGMSKSILSAMILSGRILGVENPWAKAYACTRATPFVSQTSIKENLDVGSRWVGDRFKGLFDSPEGLNPGEGKLVTVNAQKVAAYRDEAGEMHAVSAVCPHLGCIVAWNSAEKSWDCPCHGSRFSCDGEILHGPAVNKLEPR